MHTTARCTFHHHMIAIHTRAMVNCMQASIFLPVIQHFKELKMAFLSICNCVLKVVFWLKSSHHNTQLVILIVWDAPLQFLTNSLAVRSYQLHTMTHSKSKLLHIVIHICTLLTWLLIRVDITTQLIA